MKHRRTTFSKFVTALSVTVYLAASIAVPGQDKSREQDPQRPDIIKLDTALVTVPVIVTDRYGRFISGLTRQEFVVSEDGVEQNIASFSSTEAPFNVALLIDTSRSTKGKLGVIRKAALDFIKQLHPNDRVLVVTFDERVQFIGDFTSDRRELRRAVRSVKSNYLTSLYDAIQRTINEKLMPIQGRKAIVMLTDGVDTYSRQASYESALELVATTGTPSYAIQYETRNDGVSPTSPINLPPNIWRFNFSSFAGDTQKRQARDRYQIANEFLQALAVQSGARHFRAESIENTSFAFGMIANELRNQYTLAYYPTNDKRDGSYRMLSVGVNREDLVVRSRRGYRVQKAMQEEGKDQEKKKDGDTKPR